MKTAFVYTDQYFNYDYGAIHPLKIERLRLTYDLCSSYGLFELTDTRLVVTRAARESEILRFHNPEYVEVLKQSNKGELQGFFSHGLGSPGRWWIQREQRGSRMDSGLGDHERRGPG